MATEQDSIKLYLPRDDADQLRQIARERGQTITGLLRLLIRRHIDQIEAEKAAA